MSQSSDRPSRPDLPDHLSLASLAIHGGQRPEPITGAVMPPIFTAATYVQSSPGQHSGFEYTRSHNPTRYALERMVASLEGSPVSEEQDPSCGGFAFASGLASIATVLDMLEQGSHVVAMDDLYGGTRRQMSRVKAQSQGLRFDYVDMGDLDAFERVMTPETQLVWVETPTNPLLKLVDMAALAERAKRINPSVLLACDNTFASPIFQRPLEFGFDLVMHSTTKYLNGHSDVVGGILVAGNAELAERLRFLQNAIGSVMAPFDASQTLRGIKTLDVRMQRHAANAQAVAEFLDRDPRVKQVIFPALASHPQHELYRRQMDGPSGMVTFIIDGGLDQAARFAENVRLFQLAESLGGVESLVNHPAIMTHASVPPEVRAELGIGDNLLRLSVGIESEADLLADLDQALGRALG